MHYETTVWNKQLSLLCEFNNVICLVCISLQVYMLSCHSAYVKYNIHTANKVKCLMLYFWIYSIFVVLYCRYSRRIIWLDLLTTNNDPSVIVLSYLIAVLWNEGIYVYVRTFVHVLLLPMCCLVALCQDTKLYTI